MTLKSPGARALVDAIDQGDVVTTLAGLGSFIAKSYWIGKNNRYSKNTIQKINDDFGRVPGPQTNRKHMAQYIAASCLLHCTDGWSYLGKAVFSLLRGDPHRVRHLAYYAELRAAMSLLASEGIGIFNKQHFVIDGPGSVAKIPLRRPDDNTGTHVVTWDCLEYWSKLPRSGPLFTSVITPHKRSLADWLAPIGSVGFISAQAQKWFQQWGMDLRMPAKDRHARNESSYRPDGIPDAWQLDATDALSFAAELWNLFGITGDSLFSTVDNHILRLALESAFRSTRDIDPVEDPDQFKEFILKVIEDLEVEGAMAPHWNAFLLRKTIPNNPRIFEYSALMPRDPKSPRDPNSGYAILSRAALLLRMASGAGLRLLMAAGFADDSLEFWWNSLGTSRGFWQGTKDRNDLPDLWADVFPLLERAREFLDTTPPKDQTFHQVGTTLPEVITGLGGCERFAIWSMTV